MKKLILGLVVASVAVTSAFATPPKKDVAKTTIHCAVLTGNSVNIASATKANRYTDYKGRRYFFCCDGCPQAFKKDPAKYAKHESIPIPKKAKSS